MRMSSKVWIGTFAMVWAAAGTPTASATPVRAGTSPRHAATTTIAFWHMNEGHGARVMHDSSGHGINGSIGSAVRTGIHVMSGRAYRWPFASPTQPPPKPQRLVQVANHPHLNPGARDYAITMRFRTTKSFGNIIQKGQAGSSGGYFKLQIPGGVLGCMFRGRGSGGGFKSRTIRSSSKLNDGAWHVVRCQRTKGGLTLTVDGSTKRVSGHTGRISNDNPLTIAGKLNCNQVTVTCDYFTGDIDYVKIQSG
jgi:Laminin G domain